MRSFVTFLALLCVSLLLFKGPFDLGGSLMGEYLKGKPLGKPIFALDHAGDQQPIDNERYGQYLNAGTNKFRYQINDTKSFQEAMPEGVYPNQRAIYKNPAYIAMKQKGLLAKDHWRALLSDDPQAAFYIWAAAPEPEGTKTFFSAVILERAGHILPAIQAYQSVFTLHPKTIVYARDRSFVWYPAEAAMANVKRLCRDYPQLGWEYQGGEVIIKNGGDMNVSDDLFIVTPGKFVKKQAGSLWGRLKRFIPMKVVQNRGAGKVRLVQYENGDWRMQVKGRPFVVRGVSYFPTQVGLGPKIDRKFTNRWMWQDLNQNGKIDAAYDAWVDKNKNGIQDKDEPAEGDFHLLRQMGCNAIRMYHVPSTDDRYDAKIMNKALLRKLHSKYGIYFMMGDYLGAYTLGSGATWKDGTDYTDPVQREKMKKSVKDMVMDLKDEPFILLWILGNENNMNAQSNGVNATRTNAGAKPEAYALFLNEVAEMIHQIDPDHPVAVGNLEVNLLDIYSRLAPAIDIVGVNSYRGPEGFGSLWQSARRLFNRPVLITEYGCDAYYQGVGEDEKHQKSYLEGGLRDITLNQAGGPGMGNSIGGCVFEYLDEWWKDTHSGDTENQHSITTTGVMPFADDSCHEEWFGLMSQGSGTNSPFERRPREAYFYYKKMWALE